MIELILVIISYILKRIFSSIFFAYGVLLSSIRWELKAYLIEVSIINDVYLNVVGKYALNQSLCETPVFGNRTQTVSAAMYKAKLHKFGKFWEMFVNKLDKNHFEKAYINHKKLIINEFNNL